MALAGSDACADAPGGGGPAGPCHGRATRVQIKAFTAVVGRESAHMILKGNWRPLLPFGVLSPPRRVLFRDAPRIDGQVEDADKSR